MIGNSENSQICEKKKYCREGDFTLLPQQLFSANRQAKICEHFFSLHIIKMVVLSTYFCCAIKKFQ